MAFFMVSDFLQYIQTQKRLSAHTYKAYQTDLAQLGSFLKENYSLTTIESADYLSLRAWISTLSEQGLDPKSINRKIATIRSFFKFLLKNELINIDPTVKIKNLKVKKTLPQFVKNEELIKVLDFKIDDEQSFETIRDYTVLELLYGTGIRLAELIGLQDTDIDFYNNEIKVLGKRNKQRLIPIGDILKDQLKKYITLKHARFGSNYLIVTDAGQPCYPLFIQRLTKKYLAGNVNLKKTSPHILRHTYATHLLNAGADLMAIKDLLGHSSLAATQVYTHNSIAKLKDIHKQAHPKA